ncbi:hypothetical protein [Mycobacterium riyadhense]|uniref:Uncharacterized protein n=1 Tax=Mycobacterium riyadhense TaxID=486698 RepID=A0A653EN89_9MYCO|nr:hypothetical protein [Mycobacterium riyadhense]VTO98994.1 hypothetical protein BIN_B_02783 [Mycobacterium riyadhense]
MALTHDAFNDEVDAFVDDVANAANCFPTGWTIDLTMASADRLRSVVDATLPLRGPGDGLEGGLAELSANYKLCVDSYGTHIAVEHSSFVLKAKVDRAPIIRWDYDRDARSKPRSHVQLTAHRGALSHILSRLDHKTPHSIESLHIPMGGERFRPCLEDIIEFLICDCGFEGSEGWEESIREGRARWRRIQTRAVVRDSPGCAVAELESLGYTITAPADGEREERTSRLTAW